MPYFHRYKLLVNSFIVESVKSVVTFIFEQTEYFINKQTSDFTSN